MKKNNNIIIGFLLIIILALLIVLGYLFFNKEDISPSSIAGALRTYIKEGKVGKSDCGIGTHYWVVH